VENHRDDYDVDDDVDDDNDDDNYHITNEERELRVDNARSYPFEGLILQKYLIFAIV